MLDLRFCSFYLAKIYLSKLFYHLSLCEESTEVLLASEGSYFMMR